MKKIQNQRAILIGALLLSFTASVSAQTPGTKDNSLYINQSGSTSTIGISQSGKNNSIYGVGTLPISGSNGAVNSDGSLTSLDPSNNNLAMLKGDSQSVAINQVGTANNLQLSFISSSSTLNFTANGNTSAIVDIGTAGVATTDNDYTYTGASGNPTNTSSGMTDIVNSSIKGGSNNTVVITNGYTDAAGQLYNTAINGNTNTTTIATNGAGQIVNTIQGMGATGTIANVFSDVVAVIGGVDGLSTATFGAGSSSTGGQITITSAVGDSYNTFNIGQAGPGADIAWINLNSGSSNNAINVAQSGTAQNVFSLDLTGNSNLFNVSQTSGAAVAQTNTAVVISNGASNTWSLSQHH
jgi:hypothetical protein